MSDKRLIGLVVAAAVVVGLVLFGVYHFKTPSTEPKPQAEQSAPAPEAPKAEGETAPAESSKSASQVPSFDVVRIEGTGEGVIAGRAAPGWAVRVESNGTTVAETTADAEGAWTVVLDKPLAAGDHALSLKAISPDGTSSLTAQQPVKVTVGEGTEVAAKPAEPEGSKSAEAPAKPPRPIFFRDVQYEDAGPDSGKLTIAGEGPPGASILLFFDDQALGQVTIGPDGTWSFEADTKVDKADHMLRADLIEAGTGVVAGRTAAAFRRREDAAATSQPQPVYPGGPPPAAPAPSYPQTAAEPVSVANQPQPVYPGAAPATEPATAVAEADPSLASQPQPVYPSGAPDGVAAAGDAETAAADQAGQSQPQPVYPGGPPPAATTPSYPQTEAEPASVANQPQPVFPSTAAPSLDTQPQPVVPGEDEAVVAERPGETPRVHTQPMVVFRSADYRDTGEESGTLGLSGTGDPGARIQLFLDNSPLGEVTVGSDGNWSFETETKLAAGEHTFRADRIDAETGAVAGRASIGMARMEKPKEEEVAAQEPAPAEPEAAPQEEAAPTEEAAPAKTQADRRRSRVYTVRRGDTLWDIAEYYYGGGWRYRAIVRENRRKIKDPHWIYPRQEFNIPIQR